MDKYTASIKKLETRVETKSAIKGDSSEHSSKELYYSESTCPKCQHTHAASVIQRDDGYIYLKWH